MRISAAGLLVFFLASAFPVVARQRPEQPPDRPVTSTGNPLIREGDAQYGRRQENRVGSMADRGPIAAAVRAYDTARQAPDSVEARWKLMRALVFQGSYAESDASTRKAIFEKARRISEEAIGLLEGRSKRAKGREFDFSDLPELAELVRKDSDAAPTFYWAAASWGLWALARDKEEATKLGAAEKIRSYATLLTLIDPSFEDGGGYRLLGRLHDLAPRIQFESEWISRDEGIRNLRLALRTDPADFANRLYLAEALARGSVEERREAVSIVERLVTESPSPARLVEELRLQEDAARDLAAWKQ